MEQESIPRNWVRFGTFVDIIIVASCLDRIASHIFEIPEWLDSTFNCIYYVVACIYIVLFLRFRSDRDMRPQINFWHKWLFLISVFIVVGIPVIALLERLGIID